jgi:hypothetical protein
MAFSNMRYDDAFCAVENFAVITGEIVEASVREGRCVNGEAEARVDPDTSLVGML